MTSLDRVAPAAARIGIAVGGVALAGWMFDVEALKGAGGTITMKPNAALGLVLSGSALAVYVRRRPSRLVYVADACALLAGTLGLLTLIQHITGWDFGINEMLFAEAPGAAATTSPARMGPNGSLSLTLGGLALLLLPRWPRASQFLAFAIQVLAMIALVGYWYRAEALYSIARYTGIAWQTALTLHILSVGIMTAHADVGPVATLGSSSPGGVIARRLVLPSLFVPLTLGYAALLGQRAGLYDSALGTALLVVTLSVLLTGLIWQTAVTLDASNRAREAVQRERDELLLREQEAREVAERANQLKDEFLATVSHELRTPLNAIVGWTQMLQSNLIREDRRAHAAGVVVRNGRFLARLIEDLLDVSRITTGQLTLDKRPVTLSSIAERALDAIESSAREKRVDLTSRIGAREAIVCGDAERLEQVVSNLLSNAVKFTPSGGSVVLSIAADDGRATLTVSDNGRGIQPDFLPFVFERFRQEDAKATREIGGLGLGLSIARELAHLHDGTLQAASEGIGRGSTFMLTLPLVDGVTTRPGRGI